MSTSRIVIFANGQLNYPELLLEHLRPEDRIFCADGGTSHALALGLTPEMIIGDLDSLSTEIIQEMETAGVRLRLYPKAKDQTDLELALDIAIAENPAEILLLTALGGRLDQTLANIFLLTRPEYANVRLTILDGPQSAFIIQGGKTLILEGQPGDTLSLIPLTAEVSGVTFEGVSWPLKEATLIMGSTWSISNVLAEQSARVRIGTGMVLLVQLKRDYKLEV